MSHRPRALSTGTSAASLTLTAVDASLVTAHTVVLPGLAAGTTYYFRVISVDAASNVATLPVPTTPPAGFSTFNTTGLVAAFAFNEGAGGTVTDLSGMGNHGTISGATWTSAGRYGSALSFDGVSNWVTVEDSPSLDLTNGMTLEAWVRPASVAGWQTIFYKERPGPNGGLSWGLYASDNNAPPALYAGTYRESVEPHHRRVAAGVEHVDARGWNV